MGIDYSFDLSFPREEVWNVLKSVAKMSVEPDKVHVELILPDRRIALPFIQGSGTKTILLSSPEQYFTFDSALCFEPDEAINEYVAEREKYFRGQADYGRDWEQLKDANGRVYIGYIYIHITPYFPSMPKIARFDFLAATSRMSHLFIQSQSVQKTFLELLKAHNGIVGNLNDPDEHEKCIHIYPPNFDIEQFRRDYWE